MIFNQHKALATEIINNVKSYPLYRERITEISGCRGRRVISVTNIEGNTRIKFVLYLFH